MYRSLFRILAVMALVGMLAGLGPSAGAWQGSDAATPMSGSDESLQ